MLYFAALIQQTPTDKDKDSKKFLDGIYVSEKGAVVETTAQTYWAGFYGLAQARSTEISIVGPSPAPNLWQVRW